MPSVQFGLLLLTALDNGDFLRNFFYRKVSLQNTVV